MVVELVHEVAVQAMERSDMVTSRHRSDSSYLKTIS